MKKIIFGLVATSALMFANEQLKTLEKECENGVIKSCYLAGVEYYETEQNYEKALKYFTKGCEVKEDSEDKFSSCFYLGTTYLQGLGVEKNYKKAVEILTKACNGKNGRGCLTLAIAYEAGLGVEKDTTKATAIHRNNCDENNFFLGCLLFAENSENLDKQTAAIYYKKACDIGKNDVVQQVPQMIWQNACNKYKTLK